MKYLDKINKLADAFEIKLEKYAQVMPTTNSSGTTELFFGTPEKQNSFHAAIQNPAGAVFKILNDCYTKTQNPCSLDLKMSAEPGQGASWQLTVNPPNIKPAVSAALDAEYRKIMNTSMGERQRFADGKSKTENAGTGTQDVGSMDLS